MEMTEGQQQIMASDGNLLVTGGPGSGKTTISILKAAQIAEQYARSGQKVLFLSFARATVSRVIEAIGCEQRISAATKKVIDIDTYHAFFWRILTTYGYLIGLPRRLNILTPPKEAVALSKVRSGFAVKNLSDEQKKVKQSAEMEERTRLAMDEGYICFDLFALYAGAILHGSERIRHLISLMYPAIILDEFQDTNKSQWHVVQALGKCSRLVALADPEQRIYDWIGADPARLDHFREKFSPNEVDLGKDNHRSAGTDITIFGNDLLSGKFRQSQYNGVVINFFVSFQVPAMTKLVTTIYAARQRLIAQCIKNWTLAVLVPTKKLTRMVSDALRHPPAGMSKVSHTAAVEMEGAILAAEIVSFLMQPSVEGCHFAQFVDLLCNYFRGKGGSDPTKGALSAAMNIRRSYEDFLARASNGKGLRKNSIFSSVVEVYEKVRSLAVTGDPGKDWHSITQILENSSCQCLKEIAEEVGSISLLGKGTQLRQQLAQDWLDNGYKNALSIIRHAFVQEHLYTGTKPETGVVVMNMHKAKGKQFDEVIIFEGWPNKARGKIIANANRIVRSNSRDQINDQARQNLRVSITRGKCRVTILTPGDDPCVLLPSDS